MSVGVYELSSGIARTPSSMRLFRMPGGEWHVTGQRLSGTQLAYVRGATADDLLALSVWADAVHRDGGLAYAFIPYLPGARQDRRREGEALSAKVYANIINGCQLSKVVCFDPHSDVMPALIDNCMIVRSTEVVRRALALNPQENVCGVISPDAGAAKRASAAADIMKVPVFHAFKHRDMATGKLSGFTCEALPAEGRMLVVDDICDGGGTFNGLAVALGVPRERLALYISHGVFSKGYQALRDHYSAIYTTDSYPSPAIDPASDPDTSSIVHRFPIFETLLEQLVSHA